MLRLPFTSLPSATIELARALIGATLSTSTPEGRVSGCIVETEAYPPGDPASHAYAGLRRRNASMFGPPLQAYVYRIYGASWCFNVTSEEAGTGAAVLIRALEPLEGLELMASRRKSAALRDLCRGPGRLCSALAIDGSFDGLSLTIGSPIQLELALPRGGMGSSRRIGISKAMESRLRFYRRGSPFVSGPRALSP